jgi:uroporphyrin-3 C-methyltransferase
MNTTPEQNTPGTTKSKLRWLILIILLLIIVVVGLGCLQILKLQKNLLNTTQQLHYLNLSAQQQIQSSTQNKLTIAKLSQKLNQNEAALLKMADRYVQHLDDPDLQNLHKILSDNIATLQNMPKVDVPDIYMRIQSLSNQIKQIPLVDQFSNKKKPVAPKATVTKTTQPLWKRFFTGTWGTIKTFLVIRHHQQPVQPLLSAQQHQIIITKLQILCAQAQWALLQRRDKLYHDLLQKIQQSIKEHFSENSKYTIKILREISELQKINLDVQPPKLDNALQMINKIDRLQYQKFVQKLKPAKEK